MILKKHKNISLKTWEAVVIEIALKIVEIETALKIAVIKTNAQNPKLILKIRVILIRIIVNDKISFKAKINKKYD